MKQIQNIQKHNQDITSFDTLSCAWGYNQPEVRLGSDGLFWANMS